MLCVCFKFESYLIGSGDTADSELVSRELRATNVFMHYICKKNESGALEVACFCENLAT